MNGTELTKIAQDVARLRGNPEAPVDASIGIPVNAQGDLENVLHVVRDITTYSGKHRLEIVLVINNYPPDEPPPEIASYRRLGLKIIDVPACRRPGEAVGFSARMHAVKNAASENVILFDADCRVTNPPALIDWYIRQFKAGAQAAYSHVGYFDLKDHWSIRLRMRIHHGSRWVKRRIMGIPTVRGSNYAVNRTMMVELYDKGLLADDLNVGPVFKAAGGKVVYSGAKQLTVLTSGRMFNPGTLKKLYRYFTYRFFYNLRVLRVRANAARYTGREKDKDRKFVNNQLVK